MKDSLSDDDSNLEMVEKVQLLKLLPTGKPTENNENEALIDYLYNMGTDSINDIVCDNNVNSDVDGKEQLLKLLSHGKSEKNEDEVFIDYLNKLGTRSINDIENELLHLKEQKSDIINQAKEAAYANYKTFIETHQCSGKIFRSLCHAEDNLNSLTDSIPNLISKCEQFKEELNEIKTEREINSLLLAYNSQILQLLELPQLMLTSIRKSSYEDAFHLSAYVKHLTEKHQNISVIKDIEKDIGKYWWEMMNHLIGQLHNDIQLPKCLQVMGYLRRMDIFTEVELRLKFLQARNNWLETLLANIPTDDYNYHLNKTIDLSRVNIFNIITQYKAVFTEDEVIGRQDDPKSSFFHMWLSKKINDFLQTVEKDLPYCSSNSLDSLFGQCMYFGLSFGRIGADFRGLIQSSFIKTVEFHFQNALKNADANLQKDMENYILCKDASITDVLYTLNEEIQSNDQENPPMCLLEFHPLANYCNNILIAFNNLRLCAPLNVLDRVTNILQYSLKNTSLVLLKFYKREKHTFSTVDREVFGRLCESFAKLILPFIQNCLHAIFKPSDIASYYSMSMSELEKQGLGYFDIADILNAINEILLTLEVVADSVV